MNNCSSDEEFEKILLSDRSSHQKCSRKILQILQNSQENSCVRVYFLLKLQVTFLPATLLTLFRMGGGKKAPLPIFPVTFSNVGITLKNFLTFTFNSFGTLVQNFKAIPGANPKLLNLNQDHPSKKVNFLVKCLQN